MTQGSIHEASRDNLTHRNRVVPASYGALLALFTCIGAAQTFTRGLGRRPEAQPARARRDQQRQDSRPDALGRRTLSVRRGLTRHRLCSCGIANVNDATAKTHKIAEACANEIMLDDPAWRVGLTQPIIDDISNSLRRIDEIEGAEQATSRTLYPETEQFCDNGLPLTVMRGIMACRSI